MNAPLLRPLGIGEILDVSIKITLRNIGALVRIVLFVVLPAQALTALVDVSAVPGYQPGGFTNAFRPQSGTVSSGDTWTIVAAVVTAGLISLLAGQLATAACFKAVGEAYLGGRPSWRASLRLAVSRFHSVIWLVLLGGIVTALGFVACVIPGLYFYVAFAVALPVLLFEGKKGRKALGRSRELVRGRWWKTAVLLLVGGILLGIVGGVVSGLVSAVTFVHGGDNAVVRFLVAAIAGTAAAIVTTPFKAAYVNVLYYDLRVRKEAFDLQLLAQRIGVEPPAGAELPPPVLSEPERPPFWPPPPGWTRTPGHEPSWQPRPEPETSGDEPPFWPPPPGWKPRGSDS